MNTAYTVTVLHDGTMACAQRIDLEVRLARELERLLGGEQQVASTYRAALQAKDIEADALRWQKAFGEAGLTVRQKAELPELDFRVDLAAAGVGAGS